MYKNILVISFQVFLFILGNSSYAENLDKGEKCYENKDYECALKFLLPVVEKGEAKAQHLLSIMYFKSWGVEKDFKKSFELSRKASLQEYAEAQSALSSKLWTGYGVEKNEKESAFWLKKAAENGHIRSQFNLAGKYSRGDKGIEMNKEKALYWMKKAAEKGHAMSQMVLARKYLANSNAEKAKYWYDLSCKNEDDGFECPRGWKLVSEIYGK